MNTSMSPGDPDVGAWYARYAPRLRVAGLIGSEFPVALHLIEGLRFRDVGERPGIPLATVATKIRRGKRRLRALLEATNANFSESKSA